MATWEEKYWRAVRNAPRSSPQSSSKEHAGRLGCKATGALVILRRINGEIVQVGEPKGPKERANFVMMSRNGRADQNDGYLDWSGFRTFDNARQLFSETWAERADTTSDDFFIIVEK